VPPEDEQSGLRHGTLPDQLRKLFEGEWTIGGGSMTPGEVMALVVKAETYSEVCRYIIQNREELAQVVTPDAALRKVVDQLLAMSEEMATSAMIEAAKWGRKKAN
jgi:hypothetical protein